MLLVLLNTISMLIISFFTFELISKMLFNRDDLTSALPFLMGGSKASVVEDNEVRFKDVIGLKNVKRDLRQYLNYINHRQEYIDAGFKVPTGLIFAGPPGTGKTLLSKAMAGDTNSTFIYVCGSDFIEVFVGVGAQRIRKLFQQARESKPAIIFIDEIDSIGRSRGSYNGHSEHDSTLNQLLEEMDGFKDTDGIMVIAATNMYSSLDPALQRSGRFDRKIVFNKPNIDERKQMFEMYLKKIRLAKTFKDDYENSVSQLAKMTAGATGADIANIANQGVSHYIGRRFPTDEDESENDESGDQPDEQTDEKKGDQPDEKSDEKSDEDPDPDDGATFDDLVKAIDEVIVGIEKKERLMSDKEKKIVAHHEAGHALMAYLMQDTEPPIKVSIIPRGEAALGFSMQEPIDKKLHQYEELLSQLCVLIGGRIGEKITFGRISTGASDDLQKMTQIAYQMVTVYGMSPKIGPMNLMLDHSSKPSMLEDLSDQRKQEIDEEVKKLLEMVTAYTEETLRKHQGYMNQLAEYLLEHEVITSDQITEMLGDSGIENSCQLRGPRW